MAFFPCIHFCDAKTMMFKGTHISMKKWSLEQIMAFNIDSAHEREKFYILLLKLSGIVSKRKLRMIIENPWNTSRGTYLQQNFINPSLIDTNRSLRGDYFVKPTAYWYIGCNPTSGHSMQKNTDIKIVYKQRDKQFVKGQCSEQRSLISPDYARNFICDFILGKEQDSTMPTLF
jgi:hypothetical protein